MKGDRFGIPVEAAYVEAVGRAAYIFARMEWDVAWCCERMRRNYLNTLKKKTAGIIANDFLALSNRRPLTIKADCVFAAKEFKRLVLVRNRLLHAKPSTAPGGEQQLAHDGKHWTIAMIDDAADEFAAGAKLVNALLYNQLK